MDDISPFAEANSRSKNSVPIKGIMACASGSPNLTLYSTTLGPSEVIIIPTYNTPEYGMFSLLIASIVGLMIVDSIVLNISSVTIGAGL